MKRVLGFELSHAVRLLEAEGARVQCVETASRKGVAGNEKRVVRQRETEDGVELLYAVFKTDHTYVGG